MEEVIASYCFLFSFACCEAAVYSFACSSSFAWRSFSFACSIIVWKHWPVVKINSDLWLFHTRDAWSMGRLIHLLWLKSLEAFHGHWCMYRPMRWQQNIWGEAFAWTSKDRRRSFYIIYANPKKFFSNAGPFLALLHIAPFLFISRGRFISSAWRFQHVFIAHHRHQIW